jgi:hypothetical protein
MKKALEGIPETEREELKHKKTDEDEWFKNRKKLLIQLKHYPEPRPVLLRESLLVCVPGTVEISEGTPGELDPRNTLVAKDPMPLGLGLAMLWALCSTYQECCGTGRNLL